MIATALLLAAAAPPSGGHAIAYATARVVRGERISFAEPLRAPDRMVRETRRLQPEGVTRLHLVEFH
jgi:hypothetical protein